MHDAVGPLILVAAMAALHIGYFLALRGWPGQQAIHLPPARPEAPPPTTRARLLPLGPKGPPADPVRQRVGLTVEAGLFRRPLICERDLTVAGQALFTGAVKVQGDLLIRGVAIFDEPVVVNGRVRVTGTAAFRAGLLVKSELQVDGRMTVGAAGSGAWLAARSVRIDGGLWVNGQPERALEAPRGAASA